MLARGGSRGKRIQWRVEAELVDIRYFEMDETERANVWKLKSFDDMRKAESAREKEKVAFSHNVEAEEAAAEAREWKVDRLEFKDAEVQEQVAERFFFRSCVGQCNMFSRTMPVLGVVSLVRTQPSSCLIFHRDLDQVEKIWAVYGKDSQEKLVQEEREGRVLK